MNTPSTQRRHTEFMRRAIRLARKGLGRVEPNPMVGCVIVKKGRVVGEGYHHRFGGHHAEVLALRQAGSEAAGATAYVTLEPCNHHGKTPPCTVALQSARIGNVVAAMRDPNPLVAGGGFRALRKSGIPVTVGLLRDEALKLNAAYVKLQTLGRPYVIAKWAQSIDGKIATSSGESKWISSAAARKWVHRIRSRVDGIIVGSGTVLQDDPQLTCRGVPVRRVARRIILDTRLRTPLHCRVVQSAAKIPTALFTSRPAGTRPKARQLRKFGAAVHTVPLRNGHVDFEAVLRKLAQQGMANVLIEGGGDVLGSAFDLDLIDEVFVFVAPQLIGGRRAPTALAGNGLTTIRRSGRLKELVTRRIGPDLLYNFRM